MTAVAGLDSHDGWEIGMALRSLDPAKDLEDQGLLIKLVLLLDDPSWVSTDAEELSAEDEELKQWLLDRRAAIIKTHEERRQQADQDTEAAELPELGLEESCWDEHSEEEAFAEEEELDNGFGSFMVSDLARGILDEWLQLDPALSDAGVLALFDATASEHRRESQTWMNEHFEDHRFQDPEAAARSLAVIAMDSGDNIRMRLEALGSSQVTWILDQALRPGACTALVLEACHDLYGEPALMQIVDRLSSSAEPLDHHAFYFLLDPVYRLARRDREAAPMAREVLERLRKGGLGVVSGYVYLLDSSRRADFVAWLTSPDGGAYISDFLKLLGKTELPADFPGKEVCRAAVKNAGAEQVELFEKYYDSRADFLRALVEYMDSDQWAFKFLKELAELGEVARDAELSSRFFNGNRTNLCTFDVDGRHTKRGHPHIWTTLSHIEEGWGDLVAISQMGDKRPLGMEAAVAGYLQDRQILVSQAARALGDWRPEGEQLEIVRDACAFELEKLRLDLEWHRARGLTAEEHSRIHRSLSKGWAALRLFAERNGLDGTVEKLNDLLTRTDPKNLKPEDLAPEEPEPPGRDRPGARAHGKQITR